MEVKRAACPKCDNNNRRRILEEPDKGTVLYYSMQGTPVYRTILKCGTCGEKWDKN
jgi:hypothetical protein